jgi:hypothetical protein
MSASDDRPGGRAVDRVEHEDVGAVGQGCLGLRLLLGRILVGVAVEDLAVGAQVLDLGLEQRAVLRLVAGGLGLGQQEGDLEVASASARAAATAVVVVAARSRADDEHQAQRRRDHAPDASGSEHGAVPLGREAEPIGEAVARAAAPKRHARRATSSRSRRRSRRGRADVTIRGPS